MKRLLILLFSPLLLLGACGGTDNKSNEVNANIDEDIPKVDEKEVVDVEVIKEKEYEIILLDNDDLKITMINSLQERAFDYETKDVLFIEFSIENKQNRTFTILIDNISLDGSSRDYDIGMTETEIGPEEQKTITANFSLNVLEDNKKISFEEHFSGRFTYRDFDGNREQIRFSEYINE